MIAAYIYFKLLWLNMTKTFCQAIDILVDVWFTNTICIENFYYIPVGLWEWYYNHIDFSSNYK